MSSTELTAVLITAPDRAVEAEGVGQDAEQGRRHHYDADERQGERVAEQAEGNGRLEMVGAERSRREAGDERRRGEPDQRTPGPGDGAGDRAAGQNARPRAGQQRRDRDQGGDRAEGHLEARPEQRFGLPRQHEKRRDGEVAQAESRPVGENGAEHHQRHHQRALRGNLGPGEHAVCRRADHPDHGRNLLAGQRRADAGKAA
jgi:hypothetical protein